MAAALRTVRATRYSEALREGGSMPGLVEADDDGLYVVKFRGAGQGVKALVAEVLVGEIARLLGLRVPEIVLVDVDPRLADAEPDPEIQELVHASPGLNAGLDFLPSALPFSPAAPAGVTPELAADVVWLDALCANVDRTPRNPNMLVWHGDLWLIDHGAALYRHHAPSWPDGAAGATFPLIADHVLLPFAGSILEAASASRPSSIATPSRGSPNSCPTTGSPATRAPRAPSTPITSLSASRRRARSPPRPRRRAVPHSEQDAFQYAIWRVVPSVERGEALNVGVVVFCRRRRFLEARIAIHEDRLRALSPTLDVDAVRRHLDGMVRVAAGDPAGGAVARLDQSERFGWLTAASSTIVQPSPIHTGLCDDPEAVLDRLFRRLVA